MDYQAQLACCKNVDDFYAHIWKSKVWNITDYEELFKDIERGYVIQSPKNHKFIINPEWKEEDSIAHPVYKCDGGCGTIMGSDDDCKRICDDCEDEE